MGNFIKIILLTVLTLNIAESGHCSEKQTAYCTAYSLEDLESQTPFKFSRCNEAEDPLDPQATKRLQDALEKAQLECQDAVVGESCTVYIPISPIDLDPTQLERASRLYMYGEAEFNLDAQLNVSRRIEDFESFLKHAQGLPSSLRFSDFPMAFQETAPDLKNTLNAMMEDIQSLRGNPQDEDDRINIVTCLGLIKTCGPEYNELAKYGRLTAYGSLESQLVARLRA